MNELALAAAIYFDHELAANPAPIVALWSAIASADDTPLRQWWSTERAPHKPQPLELDALGAKVAAGGTVTAAIESVEPGVLVLAQTTPAAKLREGVPPRHWKYDAVVALGPRQVERIGSERAIEAIVAFADAVAVKAGIVVWSRSLAYASAIAMGASSSELTPDQSQQVTDSYYWRSHWGRVIRGPAWGTFLGASHVAALGDIAMLPAARIVPLASGGAFVQLTSLSDVTPLEEPSPALATLQAALSAVVPH
ncbi:MAG TPA: hypothetical protein VFQ53_18965 [Kofleriaceae bacterium]|nr:hypothetical protein [Kofleriaceae bacterium]